MELSLNASRPRAVLPPPCRGLSRVEAAGYIGVSPSLFDQMVDDGRMPRPTRINTRKVWDARSIDRAFEALPIDGEESGSLNTWDDF